MAGWYHSHTRREGSAHKVVPIRRTDAPQAKSSKSDGLAEARMLLVVAYCGAYPEDADERRQCNNELRAGLED